MGKPVKITVIGAGSTTFALGLVKDLCLTQNLAGSLVSFMDVDETRLEMIYALAQRYVKELGGKLTFERTTDRAASLRDADFVINTAGKEYAYSDERRALVSKYYRTGVNFPVTYMMNLPLMLEVARDIERICPNAWLIQSGNPVHPGTDLVVRQTAAKIIGLCHGHNGYRNVANVLGLDPDKVRWVAPGLNHIIWMNEFRYEGQDAYPILDAWIETQAEAYWQDHVDHPDKYGLEDQMSRVVIDQYRRFGLLPLGDTTRGGGWWYKTDLDTQLYWYGPTGGFGSDVHRGPFMKRHYARLDEIHAVAQDPSQSVLKAFPPVKTREQQVPIIDALANDVADIFQINVANQGALPGVADHIVTEGPALIDAGGIHRIHVKPLPKKLMIEVIQPHLLSMEWELEAFLTGDRDMLVEGLLMLHTYDHQMALSDPPMSAEAKGSAMPDRDARSTPTASYEQAKAFVDDMLAQPYEAELAAIFAERKPSWARLVDKQNRKG